jgi:hypothetical protein
MPPSQIVPSRPWRMTRIQTRIPHVHPTASIHQRGTLLRLCYCGVLRAGAPPAMLWRTRVLVTRSEATMEGWIEAAQTTRRSSRSEPAEERAQPAEGRSIRADDVYPECWRSTHLSDGGGDTPCASGHCMCDLHMHMCRYDRAEVVLTLFRSIRRQICR